MFGYLIKRIGRAFKHKVDAMLHTGNLPAPYIYKHTLLLDFFPSNSLAIETGTYLGETTVVLANHCEKVISLEPFKPLFDYNSNRFREVANIEIRNQNSQEGLARALEGLDGPVSFWLDGHYSGSGTYGDLENASPILSELEAIGRWIDARGGSAYIAIDDARLFTGVDGYPDEESIERFARKFGLALFRFRDIFFMKPN